jgi:Cell wall-active antibiotics response 4TMS YvqF/Domain of unknown function (DUF5668)
MPKRRNENDPPLPRLIFGLAVAATGLIFWLDRLGRLDARDYLEWWPLAAVVMGLAYFVHRKWVGAAIWILIGTYFLLPMFGLPQLAFWRIIGVWPLLISAGGVLLVMQGLRAREHSFSATAVMAGNVQKFGAQFRGGEAVAVMGGCTVDLSAASIAGEAVVDVLTFWGGIEVVVPRGWEVISRLTLILGGLELKTDPAPANAPRLVLRGGAVMGGVDVRHPKEKA